MAAHGPGIERQSMPEAGSEVPSGVQSLHLVEEVQDESVRLGCPVFAQAAPDGDQPAVEKGRSGDQRAV